MGYEGTLGNRSNRADWVDVVEVRGPDKELMDLSTATEIVVQVAPKQYGEYGGYSEQSYAAPMLTATLSNGKVAHVELGKFEFSFTKGEMRGICGGVYDVEITVEKDGRTTSVFLGTVPIREGVVTL